MSGTTRAVPWAEVLDRLDATLDAAWVAIGAADLDAATAAVGELGAEISGLPVLPAHLAQRATAIVTRIDDLAAVVDTARLEVRRELHALEHLAPSDPAVPRFIDRRA